MYMMNAHTLKSSYYIHTCTKLHVGMVTDISEVYAVKVKRHNVVRGGPLSWVPGMRFTQCKFRL